MSNYIPSEFIQGVIEKIINETSKRLIIIYPFNDVPGFLWDIIQLRSNDNPLTLVVVFSRNVLRHNLAALSKMGNRFNNVDLELRVINNLYNSCFVNDENLLMILPEAESSFYNASFGWHAGVDNTASDIYHETLLYINDIMKKSHLVSP